MRKVTRKSQSIDSLVRKNTKIAKHLLSGELGPAHLSALAELTRHSGLSLGSNEILWLNGGWYVTGGGLLRVAEKNHCRGIRTHAISKFCDPSRNRWVFKATVYKSLRSRGFVGYGDAEPSNVSAQVAGAEMRVAETRAVNRALRKAYGIGLCSVEELGYLSSPPKPDGTKGIARGNSNGNGPGTPRVRDKLCLLIRNYDLDPTLVKRYAVDFCGTETLRDASRDLVEAFVSTIAEEAANNRAALVCKLNSYNQPEEVRP
jgi:hypothetical protein